MMTSKSCPKCQHKDIVRVSGEPSENSATNTIGLGGMVRGISVTRLVCCQCGYTEEWIESVADRNLIKKQFGGSN